MTPSYHDVGRKDLHLEIETQMVIEGGQEKHRDDSRPHLTPTCVPCSEMGSEGG